MVKIQKKAVGKINYQLKVATALILSVYITGATVLFFDTSAGEITNLFLDVFIAGSLVFSVYHMRRSIKKSKFAFPNEKIVLIHLTNFSVWILL